MDLLCGEFSHQLDGKNRIRIPAKFRAKLGENYCFAILPGCIGVYSEEEIKRVLDKLKNITTGDKERYKAKSIFVGSITDVSEDDQSRTVLSAFYRNYAGIQKDVVTVGAIDHLEIWAKEKRDSMLSEMSITDAATLLDI